jgi:hypothetical protein
MCAQAGVRLGIVTKEKDIFHVLVRKIYMETVLQFFKVFLYLSELIMIPFSKKSTRKIPFLFQSANAVTFSCRDNLKNCDNASAEFIQTKTCAHVRQSQKWYRQFFSILLTAQTWIL